MSGHHGVSCVKNTITEVRSCAPVSYQCATRLRGAGTMAAMTMVPVEEKLNAAPLPEWGSSGIYVGLAKG
jgi:hypothetical protein